MSLRDHISEENPEALFADGLDDALVGVARRCGQPALAVYDYQKAIDIFVTQEGMSYEQAIEHLEYNVVGTWLGPHTPVWLCKEEKDE